ncbi:MAG: DUF1501 domain-containing protein, partial [Planctomycetota bacterium]
LAVRPPGSAPDRALDLDGFFGLHPDGARLLRPYGDGQLLFVHASGLAGPDRSHFDAQKRMETATPVAQQGFLNSGWLGRHLQTASPAGAGGIRGLGVGNLLAQTLGGAPETLPIKDIGKFSFPGRNASRDERRELLDQQYDSAPPLLAASADSSLLAIDLLAAVDYGNYVEAPGAAYPDTTFGKALRQVAALIKADIDLEAAQINLGGWDHHSAQGVIGGQFADHFEELASAIEAFYVDLEGTGFGYTLMTHTEFGRRIRPNSNEGTDHGFGSCMMLMGPSVVGGRVLADWPGLAPESSNGAGDGDQVNGDLAVTIDWSDIAAEVLERRAGGADLGAVFPGYTPTFRDVVV